MGNEWAQDMSLPPWTLEAREPAGEVGRDKVPLLTVPRPASGAAQGRRR